MNNIQTTSWDAADHLKTKEDIIALSGSCA